MMKTNIEVERLENGRAGLNTDLALKYLKKYEWGMGHGQCWDCFGCRQNSGFWVETAGHKPGCPKAMAIEALGGEVVWEEENMQHKHYKALQSMGHQWYVHDTSDDRVVCMCGLEKDARMVADALNQVRGASE